MANELLDFVLSLRDPDVAARYADNPEQTIADAGLTNVTSADVANLIPVVSESTSVDVPVTGADAGLLGEAAGNVWASGAATAAFDAFGDHVPQEVLDDAPGLVTDLLDEPVAQAAADYAAEAGTNLSTVNAGDLGDPAAVDEFRIDDSGDDSGVADYVPIDDHDFGAEAPNFDIFE